MPFYELLAAGRDKIGRIMKVFFLISAVISLAAIGVMAQSDNPKFKAFDGQGNPATIEQIVKEIEKTDVVFLGEMHDDSVAHALQFEIFKLAVERFSAKRKIALSLEMFERDVQIVLNEYLAGLISESHFLLSSRPWGNYKTDYRPLVELAKEKKLGVLAANAPRRYVNMVSRSGRDSLNRLSPEAKRWLAPLPYAEPSEAYSNKFRALMGTSSEAKLGIDKILGSQSLWDATMAYAIAENQKKEKDSLIIHLNGSFHTENRLGTVEHLLKYSPKTKMLVITMRYEDDFGKFDSAKHANLGDFVILTDAKQPRSQR